jgi:hypothetical protein
MNLGYLAIKIYNKFEIYNLGNHKIDENLYLLNKHNKKIKSILFYFPDFRFMHFGDHLFFEPLARELKEKKYEVYILPIKEMEFYFKKLGFVLGNSKQLDTVDLVLTKVEFIPDLSRLENQILYIDTATSKTRLPLCTALIHKVFQFLKEDPSGCNDIPSYIKGEKTNIDAKLDMDENYILFNNYIDSGFFRIGKKHQNMIVSYVQKLKENTGHKIIHTGSEKDKERDNNVYRYVDIDLRGDTSIEDLFYLSSLDNIIYNVSYDCFQMHLFFMKNKTSFILFRGRYLKKNDEYIRNYVLPPFVFGGKVTDLIEYIE